MSEKSLLQFEQRTTTNQQELELKYVAYYRVSTDKQGRSGLGLEAQQSAVRNYLANKGWPPIAEFAEVESGKRNARPQLKAALDHCKVMHATLVVAKVDRLARNANFVGAILDSGVQVVFLDMPNLGEGAVPTFILQQLASVAQLEAGLISERTKAALQAARERGVRLGGDRGYRPGREAAQRAATAKSEDAQQRAERLAPIVDDIVKQGHASLAAIAAELNRREIPTPSRRGSWKPTMVSRILKRNAEGV
jgi:DNA invertase Pin-like site-specific DNA recombinase